nr:histidine phosphatase family protein [Candidatus Gracilibacteria bacterium]
MKRLIIVRHAKSGFKNTNMIDFERPLSDKGIEEIKFISKILKKLELKTDLILCSSAVRTRETLEGLWEELDGENEKVVYDKGIYDYHMSETLDYYLDLISKVNDKNNVLVIIGHNPFVSRLTGFLSGNENLGMGTLGVAIIDFDIEKWKEVREIKGILDLFINIGSYLKN